MVQHHPRSTAEPPTPGRKPFGICSLSKPTMSGWDGLRDVRITRFSKQLQLFKNTLEMSSLPCLLYGRKPERSPRFPTWREAVFQCSSGKQGLPSRYNPRFLTFLHFILQLPDVFCCYLFLIHNIKFGGKKKEKNYTWLRESACCRSPVNPQPFPDGIKLFNRSRAMDNH